MGDSFLRPALRGLAWLIFFFTIWFLWPRDLDGTVTGREGFVSVPDYAMTNARYVSVEKGKVEMESVAAESAYNLAERRMDARQVTANFYDSQSRPTLVKSKRASFFLDERRVLLQDEVEATSPDGFRMRGTEVEYLVKQRFLVATRPVEGETADRAVKIWGDRAESQIDERKAQFIGNARVHHTTGARGLTKIRGDLATLDRAREEVWFEKHVQVEQDKVVGSSERARLSYAPRERAVTYMSLLDDVRIREGKRHTRSQVAEFFAPTDTIVLTGFPAVYHGDDAVTGDRITLYRATGVVEVTQTNAAASPGQEGVAPKRPRPLTKEDEELIP